VIDRPIVLRRLATGTRATVVLCLPGGAAELDPDPAATGARAITLLVVSGTAVSSEAAADRVAALLDQLDVASVGIAGWSTGGRLGLAVAARRPELVRRLAIVATAAPDSTVDPLEFDPSDVPAKTLLVYGGREAGGVSAHGRWWQRNLPSARLEMTPDAVRLLDERWSGILSHLAPRTPGAG
jgi:pimeloyl-ACP methyl ester carboxylesterase